jgi:hypothetical protein
MKKTIYIVGLLFMTGLLACTDLDVEPKSITTPENFFNDESSYEAFIAKLYAGLAVTGQQGPAGDADIFSLDEGFSNYLRQYWQFQEITTDEAVLGWGDEGVPALNYQEWTEDNQFVRAMYYRIFFQVSMANEFIKETTDEKLDARGVTEATRAQVNEYRAEARFLRALAYWHAVDLFGDAPFYTEESGVGAAPPPLASRSEIFNFIESELNAIESELVDAGAGQYGRVDKGALWMLQAKLYLNAEVYTGSGRYGDCITAVNKILSSGAYELQDNYAHIFMADNQYSSEIIFPITFDGKSTQTWGGMTYLLHAPIGGSLDGVALETMGVNGGWFGLRTTKNIVNLFPDQTGDLDSRALFWTDGQNLEIEELGNFNHGIAVIKYKNITSDGIAGSDLTHPDTDFPMFRLADAYLMYAEAVKQGGSGGDEATAVNLINDLRERAYGSAGGNITTSDLTLEFILDERARELYWEGHRRTDLIRFGQYTENGIWPWKGGVKDGATTSSHLKVLPFPAEEVKVNSNLVQKSGY